MTKKTNQNIQLKKKIVNPGKTQGFLLACLSAAKNSLSPWQLSC